MFELDKKTRTVWKHEFYTKIENSFEKNVKIKTDFRLLQILNELSLKAFLLAK